MTTKTGDVAAPTPTEAQREAALRIVSAIGTRTDLGVPDHTEVEYVAGMLALTAASAVAEREEVVAALRALLAQCKPYVAMAESVTSGADFREQVSLTLDAIDAALAPRGGKKTEETERPQRWVCRDCGFGVKADEDGGCVHCGSDCAIVEVVYWPEDMPPLERRCGDALNGIEGDPDGAWECHRLKGHEGPHVDGDNGMRWTTGADGVRRECP